MPNGNEERMSTGKPFPDDRRPGPFGPRDPVTGLYSEGSGEPVPAPEWDAIGVGVLVGIREELATLNLSLRALVQFAAIIAQDSPQTRMLTAKSAVARAAKEIAEWNAAKEPPDAAPN